MNAGKKSLAWWLGTALVAATSLTACGGGGGGGGTYYPPTTTPVVIPTKAWYNVYGSYCSSGDPKPGCNFFSNGDKILDVEDPYFTYWYNLSFKTWYYNDSYGFSRSYTGWGWQSPTGIVYNDQGRALNYLENDGRDVVGEAEEQEANVINAVSEELAAKYQLDADVARHAAGVLHSWATLGKTRARTEADVAAFTKRLYGIDMNKISGAAESALNGDTAQAKEVLNEAASNWSTTPETMKQIIKDWYGTDLSGVGL